MNIRDAKWHGQLAVTGVGAPRNHNGSVMSIVGECLKDLTELSPRSLTNGEQEIIIRIRSKPFGPEKESLDQQAKILEVEAGLDVSSAEGGPHENESYSEFCERLEWLGIPHAAVLMIAASWFAQADKPERLEDWLHDTRAIEFRRLNSSNEAYEAATPEAYETLKRYVLAEYPEFTRDLTFRTA